MNTIITAMETIAVGVGLLGLTTVALIKLFVYAQNAVRLRTHPDISAEYRSETPSHRHTAEDDIEYHVAATAKDEIAYRVAASTGARESVSGNSRDRRTQARRRTGTRD